MDDGGAGSLSHLASDILAPADTTQGKVCLQPRMPFHMVALRKSSLCLGDYDVDLERAFGTGSTASIHHASQRERVTPSEQDFPQEMVLKVMLPPSTRKCPAERAAAAFQDELSILSDLQQHPNIIRLYGWCIVERLEASCLAIQMEYCSGGDLHDAVVRNRFSEEEAHGAMSGLLSGLAHMHDMAIVHRDVKSENVLLTSTGTIRVADFGISVRLSDGAAMKRKCGSPGYAAPEVCEGLPYDIKIDSFSAGVVLYFIISGRLPFKGSDEQKTLLKTARAVLSFRKSVCLERLSDNCKDFLRALLTKSPSDRLAAREARDIMWRLQPPDISACEVHVPDDRLSELSDFRLSRISTAYRETMVSNERETRSFVSSRRSAPSDAHASEPTGAAQILENDEVFFEFDSKPRTPSVRCRPPLAQKTLGSCAEESDTEELQPKPAKPQVPNGGCLSLRARKFHSRPEADVSITEDGGLHSESPCDSLNQAFRPGVMLRRGRAKMAASQNSTSEAPQASDEPPR